MLFKQQDALRHTVPLTKVWRQISVMYCHKCVLIWVYFLWKKNWLNNDADFAVIDNRNRKTELILLKSDQKLNSLLTIKTGIRSAALKHNAGRLYRGYIVCLQHVFDCILSQF